MYFDFIRKVSFRTTYYVHMRRKHTYTLRDGTLNSPHTDACFIRRVSVNFDCSTQVTTQRITENTTLERLTLRRISSVVPWNVRKLCRSAASMFSHFEITTYLMFRQRSSITVMKQCVLMDNTSLWECTTMFAVILRNTRVAPCTAKFFPNNELDQES